MIFAVIAVAIASVFAATHVRAWTGPIPSAWAGFSATRWWGRCWACCHSRPAQPEASVAGVGGRAGGDGPLCDRFDRQEIRDLGRFLLLGLVMSYAWIATMLGRGAAGTARAAQMARDRACGTPRGAARGGPAGSNRIAPRGRSGDGGGDEPAAARRGSPDGADLRLRADPRYGAEMPMAVDPEVLAAPARLAVPVLRPRGGLLARMPVWSSVRLHPNWSSRRCRPRPRRPMRRPRTVSARASPMRSAAAASPPPSRPLWRRNDASPPSSRARRQRRARR